MAQLAQDPVGSAGSRGATPVVSVVIPAYNCQAYIGETISSVLAQSFRDLELIVVDDGSTDRTVELAAGFGPPVRIVRQGNAGVCAARNRGIRESVGRYICLLDHDDYWLPEKLATQVALLQDRPDCGAVFSQFQWWYPDRDGLYSQPATFASEASPDGDDIDQEYTGWIYHLLLIDCWVLTSTAMIRREVFDRCGAFDETLPYSEDWDLWLRIAREYPFVKQSRATTLYRQHPDQGNRLVRKVDYRTRLLARAVERWGYCSRDERCLSRRAFDRQWARYRTDYALSRLGQGDLGPALRALGEAWVRDPAGLKRLAYMAAATLGWRPS